MPRGKTVACAQAFTRLPVSSSPNSAGRLSAYHTSFFGVFSHTLLPCRFFVVQYSQLSISLDIYLSRQLYGQLSLPILVLVLELRFEVYHERQQHCCCSSVTVREERWDRCTVVQPCQSTHIYPFSPDVYYQLGCMQPKFAETPGCPQREFDQSTESYKLLYSFQMGKGNHNYISSPLNVRD